MKTILVHYSERGLINALSNYLALGEANVKSFLRTLDGEVFQSMDSESFLEALIYVEPGFSDFGSPDLILQLKSATTNYILRLFAFWSGLKRA
jgi:hypothetical protein